MAMLSILALYDYDSTIFDNMNVPEGMTKQTVVDNILLECAELSLVYTEPTFMKRAIEQWSDKEQTVWEKLFATENFEYNPIWNVDADIVETGRSGRDSERTENATLVIDAQDQRTIAEDGGGTETESVKGYNSDSWAEHTQREIVNERDVTDNLDRDETDTETRRTVDSETGTNNLTTRRTGNIGVTTTQQMIEQEREVALFNTIDYITNSFKKRFCVMVY